MPRLLFPFRSSFYFLTVRDGSAVVAVGDGLLHVIRMTLVLTDVQIFDKEYLLYDNNTKYESVMRYSVMFGFSLLSCILLGLGIYLSKYRPWPILMVPWLIMFLCCTWIYYPNIIYHKKEPIPIIICVLMMIICLYCWSVVLSHMLDILERKARKPLPPGEDGTEGNHHDLTTHITQRDG